MEQVYHAYVYRRHAMFECHSLKNTVRDIAILVERNTKVTEALNLINAVGGKLVADVDLFEVYGFFVDNTYF